MQPFRTEETAPRGADELDLNRAIEGLLDLCVGHSGLDTPEHVARTCLEYAARCLPGFAFGVLVRHAPSRLAFEDWVVPPDVEPLIDGPPRFFPELPYERAFALSGPLTGSSLHVAGPHPLEALPSRAQRFLTKLARTFEHLVIQSLNHTAGDASPKVAELRTQLIQAEKLSSLGQVVAGVVHELSTPLTSIIAYSGYLKQKGERTGADEQDVERLRRIEESAERMLDFTRDLSAYARPANQGPETVNLHDVVRKAVVFCEHELGQNEVRLEIDLSASSPYVLGTESQLVQVFVNLLTNASHSMKNRQGSVRIVTDVGPAGESPPSSAPDTNPGDFEEEAPSRVTIAPPGPPSAGVVRARVSDHGTGISPEVLPRIFDPFYSTKNGAGGTGLGLSIVREIILGHQGNVEAISTVGEGTTFIVSLPCSENARADTGE
jgi:signal transduction histidine kinase